ncbi:MAG: hypothetical protein L3J67_03250 [Hyphomicrobiaceae bacterium]|nr:hypothetical protein [Hyphomicrobiaceae bacterium]
MFRRFCTLLGTCAFLALVALQTPVSARDQTAGAEQPDTTFWMTIKDTDLPDLFEMFIKRYPTSAHRPKAERQLRKLQGSAQPSALDQAKALIGNTPKRASITRSVTPGAPKTRAPALGAPMLAVAPAIASAATAVIAAPKATIKATMAAAALAKPAVVIAPEPVMTTTASDNVTQQDIVDESPADQPVANPAYQPEQILDDELIILLQHHLSRVGCRKGSLDGVWGSVSQKAAERFARAVNEPLVTITPTTRLLRSVKSYEAGVCSTGNYKRPPAVSTPVYKKRKTIPRRATNTKRRLKRVKARRIYKKHKIATTNRRLKAKTPRAARKVRRRKAIPRQAAKPRKVRARKKVKVATQRRAPKRKIVKRTVKKTYRKKPKGNHNFVGGDPFNSSLRAVGATAGGGRGGGWN